MPDVTFSAIVTDRLILRRFTGADAPAFSAYRSVPAVARYQSWETPFPLDQAAAFIAGLADSHPDTEGEWFQIAVALRATGQLIGDVGLHPLDGDPGSAEIGYTFDPAFAGHGYASEAVAALLTYAFTQRGKAEIMAWTDTHNARSVALLTRLGFRHDPASRHRNLFKGAWCDDDRYVMTAETWSQLSRMSS